MSTEARAAADGGLKQEREIGGSKVLSEKPLLMSEKMLLMVTGPVIVLMGIFALVI